MPLTSQAACISEEHLRVFVPQAFASHQGLERAEFLAKARARGGRASQSGLSPEGQRSGRTKRLVTLGGQVPCFWSYMLHMLCTCRFQESGWTLQRHLEGVSPCVANAGSNNLSWYSRHPKPVPSPINAENNHRNHGVSKQPPSSALEGPAPTSETTVAVCLEPLRTSQRVESPRDVTGS